MGNRIVAVLMTLWMLLGNAIPDTESVFYQEMVLPAQATIQSILGIQDTQDLQVPVGARLIVFSPHPDDESLAAAGLIQRVLENEGKVLVVFMTNGDGYVEGVRRSLGRDDLTPADFIRYGVKRRGEAVGAISALGLQAEDGMFLGFPDQGINHLWEYYWSRRKPFTSPYTGLDHAHYKAGVDHWVRYDGVDLDKQIRRTIKNFSPTMVALPDPRDKHPDHAATGIFALDALRRLALKGKIAIDEMQVLTYLVHYPGYPDGGRPPKIVPAADSTENAFSDLLSDTRWVGLTLTDGELLRKKHALNAYQTQRQVLGYFMKDFALPGELFGHLDSSRVIEVPEGAPSHKM